MQPAASSRPVFGVLGRTDKTCRCFGTRSSCKPCAQSRSSGLSHNLSGVVFRECSPLAMHVATMWRGAGPMSLQHWTRLLPRGEFSYRHLIYPPPPYLHTHTQRERQREREDTSARPRSALRLSRQSSLGPLSRRRVLRGRKMVRCSRVCWRCSGGRGGCCCQAASS